MHNKLAYLFAGLCCVALVACVAKQPIDYNYYHQTQGISYQDGGESPFTPEEIAQAQRDEEALAAALSDTSSPVNTGLWESEMRRICMDEMGFAWDTTSYRTCRSFYDQQIYQYGINADAITAAQIAAFLTWTNPIIHRCHGYGYVGDVLWGCVYRGEHRHFRAWSYHHPHYRRWEHRPHHTPSHHAPKPSHHAPKPSHHGSGKQPHHGSVNPPHHNSQPSGHGLPRSHQSVPHGGKPSGGSAHGRMDSVRGHHR